MMSASIVVAEDFKTINGKAYKNATVSRVEPDGIVLKSKSGITKLYFTEGIFANFQPVNGTNIVQVTLNLNDDHLGWDFGASQSGSAPAPRGAPQPRSRQQLPAARPQHQAMLNDKVEKLQATVAQQQKQIETLTAQLREQAEQIHKVSAQLEMVRPAPRVVENR